MLAVASDRYPRTGAIAISIMGGIGMLSAGMIGGPGLGYAKDRFAGEALQKADQGVYEQYKAGKSSQFLFFGEAIGLDGKKFGEVSGKLADARDILEKGKVEEPKPEELAKMSPEKRAESDTRIAQLKALEAKLKAGGVLKEGQKGDPKDAVVVLTDAEKKVHEASIAGDRKTLKADSFIPAAMAVIYLLVLLYFKSIGGYKTVHLEGTSAAKH
jgi:hypothetical protein